MDIAAWMAGSNPIRGNPWTESSDLLPQLVVLTEAIPVLAALRPQVRQMRLVFDANRVHAELRWPPDAAEKPFRSQCNP
jgi:hypothetical protein